MTDLFEKTTIMTTTMQQDCCGKTHIAFKLNHSTLAVKTTSLNTLLLKTITVEGKTDQPVIPPSPRRYLATTHSAGFPLNITWLHQALLFWAHYNCGEFSNNILAVIQLHPECTSKQTNGMFSIKLASFDGYKTATTAERQEIEIIHNTASSL